VSDTLSVFDDNWDELDDWSGGGAKSKGLVKRGPQLGATVYELGPGNSVVYHFHHGSEELLVVLSGRPTLRTPAGERQVDEGESVYFPLGADGAHGLKNETDEPVRVLMASTLSSPAVCEYPDLRQITAQSRTGSMTGERLWLIHDVEESHE